MEFIREALLRVAAKTDARLTAQDEWLLLSMRGEGGVVWHTFLYCAEEERLLLGYLLCPGTVPHAGYEQAMCTVGRLNEHLKFGTFVLGRVI